MRAIDADKLCTDLVARWDIADKQKDEIVRQVMANIVTPIVVSQPTIEPEIVRCKDCKHWSRESICDGFCAEDCMRHEEEFYCADAERRTDVNANT